MYGNASTRRKILDEAGGVLTDKALIKDIVNCRVCPAIGTFNSKLTRKRTGLADAVDKGYHEQPGMYCFPPPNRFSIPTPPFLS
jgi:hypothetical protein